MDFKKLLDKTIQYKKLASELEQPIVRVAEDHYGVNPDTKESYKPCFKPGDMVLWSANRNPKTKYLFLDYAPYHDNSSGHNFNPEAFSDPNSDIVAMLVEVVRVDRDGKTMWVPKYKGMSGYTFAHQCDLVKVENS
jgi:hypothetical protein